MAGRTRWVKDAYSIPSAKCDSLHHLRSGRDFRMGGQTPFVWLSLLLCRRCRNNIAVSFSIGRLSADAQQMLAFVVGSSFVSRLRMMKVRKRAVGEFARELLGSTPYRRHAKATPVNLTKVATQLDSTTPASVGFVDPTVAPFSNLIGVRPLECPKCQYENRSGAGLCRLVLPEMRSLETPP